MFIIVGLGNPGGEYQDNRHNFGFMVLDYLQEVLQFPIFSKKSRYLLSQKSVGDKQFILLKPQTFMNLSGNSVAEVARFYKIPPHNIYVFHDDLEVSFGKVKIKKGGGNGGHNGLRSIDHLLGKEYWRIRLGISHPGSPALVTSYVLGNFSPQEQYQVSLILKGIEECFPFLIGQEQLFSSKINQVLQSLLGAV
jgi:PTH1 family peptidyl-tRNA hydrolase